MHTQYTIHQYIYLNFICVSWVSKALTNYWGFTEMNAAFITPRVRQAMFMFIKNHKLTCLLLVMVTVYVLEWGLTIDPVCMQSTLYGVGVVSSYKCGATDSRQLHILTKCVQGIINIYNFLMRTKKLYILPPSLILRISYIS